MKNEMKKWNLYYTNCCDTIMVIYIYNIYSIYSAITAMVIIVTSDI